MGKERRVEGYRGEKPHFPCAPGDFLDTTQLLHNSTAVWLE